MSSLLKHTFYYTPHRCALNTSPWALQSAFVTAMVFFVCFQITIVVLKSSAQFLLDESHKK